MARTFTPCWRCGAEHTNPRSSSLCPTCGLVVAEENRQRAVVADESRQRAREQNEDRWIHLSWGEKYETDPRRAFEELADIVSEIGADRL